MHIVHLDDHQLFQKGLQQCLRPALPGVIFNTFPENDSAINYIHFCFGIGKPINLIITDYNHPGQNGFEFAKAVRELEKQFGKRVPLIMLTMHGDDEDLEQAVTDKILDGYFTKDIACEMLTDFIQKLQR